MESCQLGRWRGRGGVHSSVAEAASPGAKARSARQGDAAGLVGSGDINIVKNKERSTHYRVALSVGANT